MKMIIKKYIQKKSKKFMSKYQYQKRWNKLIHDYLLYIHKIMRQRKNTQKMYYYQKSIMNKKLNFKKISNINKKC